MSFVRASRKTILYFIHLLALCAATVHAQPSGSISGKVTDATGEFSFSDAVIRIEGQRISTVSGRDGGFRIADLAAGEYTLVAEYVGAMPERIQVNVMPGEDSYVPIRIGGGTANDGTQLRGLLVDSQVAGQAAAINRRQRSEALIDVISSDSVGNFPDQNVAEALQRAPGLSVQRDQGEGRFVVIRGIDPNFNSTTINGMRVPAPEAGSRAVNLDVISSDLVESVEINKSITPDMDGDAVGGNIEVKTLTAFDLGERSFSTTVAGSYNTTNEKTSPDLAVTYADLFSIGGGENDFGIAFTFSQFDRDTVSDGIEAAPWEILETPAGDEVRGMLEGEQRDYVLTRKRTSAALNFDYRPNNVSSFYFRTLYSEFDDQEVKLENIYKFEEGDIIALNGASGRFAGAELEKANKDSNKIMEITSYSIGGEHDLAPWIIDYNLDYAVAGEQGDLEIVGEYLAEGVDLSYTRAGDSEQPILSLDGAFGLDGSDYELQQAEGESVFAEERELALELNARRDMHFGNAPGYIQFGAKARLREKENDVNLWVYDEFDESYTIADVAAGPIDHPPRGNFGPAVDADRFRAFFNANRASFGLNEEDSAVDSRAEDYDIEEDIYAAYLMGNVDFDKVSVLAGLRVEQTEYTATGTQVVIDEENGSGDPELSEYSGDKRYTHLLPSLNIDYKLQDNMSLRAAVSRTIARPGFEAAGPWQVIEVEEGEGEFERVAEKGNTDLEPLESLNLDLRWDYYPSGVSMVSAGMFYKDISDFFLVQNTAGRGAFGNFDEVWETVNAGDAELYGIELAYLRQLDFLPGALDGLLLNASYTWTDSETDVHERSGGIPLPGQSDHIASLAIGYEKHGFNLRLAAAYRSEFFEETDDIENPAFDRYQDDHLQVDFVGKYRINDAVQVFVNVININDEPLYAYWGKPRYNSQYEEYGRTVEAGLRLNF